MGAQRGMLRRQRQHLGLQQEFQIDQATFALFQVELRRRAAVELCAHAPSHGDDIGAQRVHVACAPQYGFAHGREGRAHGLVARHAARAHQGLQLPGPGALQLVLGKTFHGRNQQALRTIGPQAHVHFVQAPRRSHRAHQADQLLREPRVITRGIQRSRAIGDCVGTRIVQENEIEVGIETELAPAHAAVGRHGETGADDAPVRAFDLGPRQAQGGAQQFLGQHRQLRRTIGRRLALRQRRHRNAERQALLEFVQDQQRGFGIVRIEPGGIARDALAQGSLVGRRPDRARVEQFVQQQGMRGQPFRQQRAARYHVHQPRQRRRLLLQQGEITRPPSDRLQQRQAARQGRIRRRTLCRRFDQRGQHMIEPLPRALGKIAHRWRAGEIAQARMMVFGLGEAGLGQHIGIAFVRQAAPVQAQHRGREATATCLQQFGERGRHHIAVRIQHRSQLGMIRITQPLCDALPQERIFRQGMRLLVAQHLHAILQAAQEQIGLAQAIGMRLRQMPGRGQCAQGRQQGALAQHQLAPAADQLQGLHQEFDFANAAGAELQIVGELALLHLGIDHRLHLAQPVERGVVEIAAIDERPQGFEQFFAGSDVARHRPRLDPGVTFPVAALALVVLLHRREAQSHATGIAEGSQAQVHAMAETIGGDIAQQLREALADAGEIGLRIQRPRAVAVAMRRKGVDQVDV